MKEFQNTLNHLFQRELDSLSNEISQYPDDKSLQRVENGITNSAANLCLHLIGNLNHYIGHQLAGTDYVRDREAEFGRDDISKEELLKKLGYCQQMLADALQKIDDPGFITKDTMTIRQFLMHLYGHLNYHLGQINYHRRLLS